MIYMALISLEMRHTVKFNGTVVTEYKQTCKPSDGSNQPLVNTAYTTGPNNQLLYVNAILTIAMMVTPHLMHRYHM